MKREGRIIMYLLVGGLIPLASQLLYPKASLWEPVSFAALVIVLGAIIEIYEATKK